MRRWDKSDGRAYVINGNLAWGETPLRPAAFSTHRPLPTYWIIALFLPFFAFFFPPPHRLRPPTSEPLLTTAASSAFFFCRRQNGRIRSFGVFLYGNVLIIFFTGHTQKRGEMGCSTWVFSKRKRSITASLLKVSVNNETKNTMINGTRQFRKVLRRRQKHEHVVFFLFSFRRTKFRFLHRRARSFPFFCFNTVNFYFTVAVRLMRAG